MVVAKTFLLRLAVDFIAASLLLVGLAYYWSDNTIHELIGTGMFLLIMVHNLFNRRWYGSMSRTRREARGLTDIALTMSLLIVVLALLLTSLMISRTVFSFLPVEGGFTARQMHAFAAYWTLILVSIHLGLRWQRLMNMMRSTFGIVGNSAARTVALRLAALAIAAYGVHSSFVMGIGSRLTLQISLEWWDFEVSTAGFFFHWISIVGLYAFLTHYTLSWIQNRKRRAASTPIVYSTKA